MWIYLKVKHVAARSRVSKKKIYYMGEPIATERTYSDGLLTKLLQVRAPERWGNRVKIDAEVKFDEGARIRAARLRSGLKIAAAAATEEIDDDLSDLLN